MQSYQKPSQSQSQVLPKLTDKNNLKIVFVTDIHQAHNNIEKLQNWYKQTSVNNKFDYCLIGGDIVNCDHQKKNHNQQEQEADCIYILKKIQQIFGCQMYYIPGNHDPLVLFEPNVHQKLKFDKIVNVHSKTILLAEGLQLMAFGGSVPGYLDKEQTKKHWDGYPYQSNKEMEEYLIANNALGFGLQKDDKAQTQTQKLVLTHCGPFSSSTAVDFRKPQSPIFGGVNKFDEILLRQDLVLFLHGHFHFGSRFCRYNEKLIINPGALQFGQFGHFQLARNKDTNKWSYKNSHFIML